MNATRWGIIALAAATGVWAAPAVDEIGPGVTLVRGQFTKGRQPDGNSVILRGTQGTVVIDTGRHREHTQRVLAVATRNSSMPVAVINTHWHLDHIGGNLAVRDRFPKAAIHASGSLAAARKGFLADYRQQLAGAVAGMPADKSASFRAEIALIDAGDKLAPDQVIKESGERTLGGRRLLIGLEREAATEGDVWVLDRESGILAAGDLVTLPVPFLDTACPDGWAAALDRLAKVDAKLVVPGHGEPLTIAQLRTYRTAFQELLSCSRSKRTTDECSSRWFTAIGDLARGTESALAQSSMKYYLDSVLRGGHADEQCKATKPKSAR